MKFFLFQHSSLAVASRGFQCASVYPNGLLFRQSILPYSRRTLSGCSLFGQFGLVDADLLRDALCLYFEQPYFLCIEDFQGYVPMNKPGWMNAGRLSLASLLLAILAAGCSTTGENLALSDGDQLLQHAQEALKSGAKVRAQKLLEDAVKTNPADKTPWIKLAQLHFDQGNYAQAVTAGQEVLARDPKEQEARSIVLVSSLRMAAKSLAEMRVMNQLTGDARMEAKKVAAILRENLGEEVLVPDINRASAAAGTDVRKSDEKGELEEAKPKPRPVSRKRKPVQAQAGAGQASAAPAAPAPATSSPSGGRSDPFSSLR